MNVIQDVHDYSGTLLPLAPSPDHVWSGEAWVLDAAFRAENLAQRLLVLCADIDREADAARLALSGDALRALEHQRANDAAKAFLAQGAPAESVPLAVQAWITEWRDARQAAEDIVVQADRFAVALLTVRRLRLQAKERVRSVNDEAEAVSARDQAVEALRQLRSGELE